LQALSPMTTTTMTTMTADLMTMTTTTATETHKWQQRLPAASYCCSIPSLQLRRCSPGSCAWCTMVCCCVGC
jgi:hypothetical protein